MAAGTCVAAIVMAAGRLIPREIPVEKRRIAEYSMLISNGSLIGLPLIQALCGERGVFYANIFMIPTRILAFTAAVSFPILLISLFRLVAAPLLTRLVCAVLGLGALETMAAVLVNAAPVASTATIFCKKYGGDAAFTSSSVFVSTLLSFGTLWFIRA